MGTLFAPLEVICSFAKADASFLEQLEHHLSLLQRRGMIATWHRHQIHAGDDRQAELEGHLNSASLILLLISPDFLASDYCYETEMQQALQRHEAGQARVIPILLRPIDWQGAPFAHLQALPTTGKAITLWSNRDAGWTDVAQGIRLVVEELQHKASVSGERNSMRRPPFPPVWNVPYRFSFLFTGREQVVEQLFTSFTSAHSSDLAPVQALSGLGGLGKTQTAVEYAYRYRQHYETVLWMNAETEEALLVSFRAAAEQLKRSAAHLQNRQSLLASMQEWFRNTTDWLLILDNADDITWMEPFLPQAASGHLLLTTRATALAHLAQPLRLHPLTPDYGALYLLRRAGYLPWTGQLSDASPASLKAAHELSQLMEGLPLALEQAGAYIEATGRGVRGYLDLYRHYRSELQRREHSPVPTYREPVAFAWSLASEMVQKENPAALELLHACAFLAPHTIPYDLFTSAASLFNPTLEQITIHPLAFDQAVAVLLKHSLIKNEVDKETDLPRLTIHPILQEVLRDSMDSQTRRSWAERVVQAVTQAASLMEEPIMQVHLQHATLILEDILKI
jgi:TIR domain/NB-ARC domain